MSHAVQVFRPLTKWLAGALGAVMLLGGCGRSADDAATHAPPAETPSATPTDARLARAAEFAERFESDREALLIGIGQMEFNAQRALLTMSGVEDELGGPYSTDLALRSLMMRMKRITAEWQPPKWTAIQNATADGSLAVAQAAVELTSISLDLRNLYGDGKAGKQGGRMKEGVFEVDVKDGTVDYHSAYEVLDKELQGKFATRMKVDACPDATGQVKIELTSKSALARAGGGGGTNITIDVKVTRQLDDDAHYAALDTETHVEHASFGANAGTFVDMTLSSGADGASSRTVNRRSSQATDVEVQNAADLAAILEMMAIAYTELAADVWRSGACVRLDPTTTPAKRTKAKPSTSFEILAAPRSRVDGSAAGGTVTASLSGDSSLDPAQTQVRSDARFKYVAPGERKKSAQVALEARSKRGIAKANVAFDTNDGAAYSAEGGAGDFHGAGVICDISAPFSIAGGGNTVRFTPSDANGGKYEYSGVMGEFTVFGHGTYTVNYADGVAVSIHATGPGSVKTPMGTTSGTGSEEYQLAPVQDCAADGA